MICLLKFPQNPKGLKIKKIKGLHCLSKNSQSEKQAIDAKLKSVLGHHIEPAKEGRINGVLGLGLTLMNSFPVNDYPK